MISQSNIARYLWRTLVYRGARRKSSVRWGTEYLVIGELNEEWESVIAVIFSAQDFAPELRAQLRAMLADDEARMELQCELALISDCGEYVFDFVYLFEGDALISHKMHAGKEVLLTGVATIVAGHNNCPKLRAVLQEHHGDGDYDAQLAIVCAKADPVLAKLESFFAPTGKLRAVFEIYHGLSLLNPFTLRAMDIGPDTELLIDKIMLVPTLAAVPDLRANLIAELVTYYVLAEGVAQTVDVLPWWFGVRHRLPNWYNHVLPEAVLMQPTSATAERVFSMLSWMFGEDQFAALEDYKETALMLRYNELQRRRAAPANQVIEL